MGNRSVETNRRRAAGLQALRTGVNDKTKRHVKHDTSGEKEGSMTKQYDRGKKTNKKNSQKTNQLLNTERIEFRRKERHPRTNLQTKSSFKTLFIYIYIFIYVSIQ